MHSTDTKSMFLELRGKGWSLARISKQINVSVRSLVDWNQQHRDELRIMPAIEIEALQEKLMASREQELLAHTELLKRMDKELAVRQVDALDTLQLFRLAAATRAEIRKMVIPADPCETSSKPQN
jgi:hypothetical protein